ncbi:MAG: hypothetical protein NTW01_14805 [Gammaproteobacteria bacterium]|nr:hypothetical protein [Gammaproteobacteria bacterium]
MARRHGSPEPKRLRRVDAAWKRLPAIMSEITDRVQGALVSSSGMLGRERNLLQ